VSEHDRVRKILTRTHPGALLLEELHAALTRYVVLPSPEATDAVVLWIAATHAQPAWEHATRLGIVAPEKRCGKSRLLDVIEGTCNRAFITVNATTAAVYRSIDADEPPTLLFDEVDAIFGSKRAAEDNEDLRALLNAGHGRGRPVLRCVGPQSVVTAFPSFAMAALAGIGTLPDTIADRAVNVRMRRRAPGESVAPFRKRRDGAPLDELRTRLHEWVREHLDHLGDAEPDMPVEDRAADTWESLIAVADLAGGSWPRRARHAALLFVASANESDAEGSLSTRLLGDIRDTYEQMTVGFLPSAELVTRLQKIDDAPWRDLDLTMRRLAIRLGEYGIKPRQNSARTARGYHGEDFIDAFNRYLPSLDPAPSVQVSESRPDLGVSPDASGGPGHIEVSAPDQVSARSPRSEADSDAWTHPDGDPPGPAPPCAECGWLPGSQGCPHLT
jgi:hypothetical protein